VDKSGITTAPSKLPKTFAGQGKNLWTRLCPQFAGSWSLLCCFSAAGKDVATTIILPRNRLCHALHSEAKCEQMVVRRHLVNKTIVSTTNITCSIYGEEYQCPPQKDWTQDHKYKEWWHKAFTAYESGQFACDCCSV